MGINITRYVNNQFEPKRKASGHFMMSTSHAAVVNTPVEFDTAVTNNGIIFDAASYDWTLKAGKRYRVMTNIGLSGSIGIHCKIQVYDKTNAAVLGSPSRQEDHTTSAQSNYNVVAVTEVTPATDIDIEVRMTDVSGATKNVQKDYSWVTIEEIDSYETPNTYPFEVNADRYDISSFCSGTNITVNEAFAIYGKTKNGYWYADLFLDLTTTSGTAFTLTISNLTFEENTNQSLHTGSYEERAYLTKNGSDISLNASSNSTSWVLGGRVLLKEKPTSI